MPARDRPKRSLRKNNDSNKPVADDDDGIHDELIDSESESEEAMPWLNKKSKEKETTEVKSIPKRKRDSNDSTQVIPPKESIKRKKKDEGINSLEKNNAPKSTSPPPSSLIANMAPVDTKKRQPAIRDWKSNEDYRAFKTREPKPSAKSSSNQPPVSEKKEENRQVMHGAKKTFTAGRNESEKSVHLELNTIITKVLMDRFQSSEGSTNTISTTSNVLDWHGSFMKEDKEEALSFSDLENRRQIPIFPEDFSRDERQWPLKWWGIQKPSDELLHQHDGRRNSRSRSSRERGHKGSKRDDHQRAEQTNRQNADGGWDRNWDMEHFGHGRDRRNSPPMSRVDTRGLPPDHYGPPRDQRMHDEMRWAGRPPTHGHQNFPHPRRR
ncbi:predicted protein [Chaetoceros tenuissimus]|uniref:Btz domain-containing protein n=1 Tax=Chaetoceros tenuissimus TaxID=426638 RepID=A0AAD3H6D3_9STRA|nr:predicted protein [Chaetoceros tenuissimus]